MTVVRFAPPAKTLLGMALNTFGYALGYITIGDFRGAMMCLRASEGWIDDIIRIERLDP